MPSMFIGGAERSLLGLLEAMDYTKTEVNFFLYRHEGEFLQYIPKQVNILPEIPQYRTFDVPIKSLLFSKYMLFGLARILSKMAIKIHCLFTKETYGVWMSMQYTAKYLLPLLPKIHGEYDMGIMFLGVADILRDKVCAKKKLAWCHTDYDTLHPARKLDSATYVAMDNVVTVSGACEEKFLHMYPEFKNKSIVVENILSKGLIVSQANEGINSFGKYLGIKLLSIGRFSEAKNFDNVPFICKAIRESGLDVQWYLIGYGGEETLIRQKIAEAGMQDYVIILGKKENPYPYIKSCNLYIQPSRYEGKCVTVREAQMLGKPVVITNYATAHSQLENGVDGVIVPMNNEDCARGIADVLHDSNLMQRLSENCKARDYSNSQEIDKIYKILKK